MDPRLSVVIPFRNAASTLPLCLRSLLAQDHGSFEVIAVDDASDDGGHEIVLRLQPDSRDRLVLVRRAEHGGAQRARVEGVSRAKGDIVVFTDADCEAPPGWLSLVESSLHSDEVAIGGQYRVPAGLPLVARFETRSLLDYWYRHMPRDTDHVATGCGAVWKKHLTQEVLSAGLAYADLTSGDDTVMSLELKRRGPLRYQPSFFVYHHTRTRLSAYLSQQVRRGRSRSRISVEHFEDKVRRSRDTRMGLVVLQIASAWGALAGAVLLLALSPRQAALVAAIPLVFLPFVALQIPLLAASIRAGEGPAFLLAVLPLCCLRNLAWGLGGLLGLSRSLLSRGGLRGAHA